MLGKLMKYEFKATARVFLPLYAALLAMAAVTKLMFSLQLQAPRVISMALSILLMVAAFVITLILTIQRFYKNLLTDEGYLMFTLPVETGRLINAKLIVAVVWTIVCTAVTFLALSVMAFSGAEWRAVIDAIRGFGFPSADMTLFIAEFVALILASLISGILTIYASMALSMLSGKHRVAVSFVFYIGLNTVMQVLLSIILGILVIPNTRMRDLVADNTVITSAKEFFTSDILSTLHVYVGIMLAVSVGFSVAMFFTTRYMLKKQLNLQ